MANNAADNVSQHCCCCWLYPQVDTLRSQVSQLELSTAAAEAEYSRQLARNREELAGLRATRGAELRAMLVRRSMTKAVVKVHYMVCLWAGLATSLCAAVAATSSLFRPSCQAVDLHVCAAVSCAG